MNGLVLKEELLEMVKGSFPKQPGFPSPVC